MIIADMYDLLTSMVCSILTADDSNSKSVQDRLEYINSGKWMCEKDD